MDNEIVVVYVDEFRLCMTALEQNLTEKRKHTDWEVALSSAPLATKPAKPVVSSGVCYASLCLSDLTNFAQTRTRAHTCKVIGHQCWLNKDVV